MAQKEATLLLKIKTEGQKALDTIKEKFAGLKSSIGAVAAPIAAVIAGLAALGAAMGKLALDASKANEVKNAFTNLANQQGKDADMMLAKMRELSLGTVSDMELMKQANQALLLGLPVDKFGDMLAIARSSAKATGQSMEFMLQSIVTGLGRGSKMILDNLGIMIDTNAAYEKYAATLGTTADKLTDAEKKTAFINEALRIGKENADAAGAGTLSLADKWEQLKASSSNLAVELGNKLLPMFNSIANVAIKVADFFSNINEKNKLLKMSSAELTAELAKHNARLEELIEKNKTAWFSGYVSEIQKEREAVSQLTEALKNQLIEEEKLQQVQTIKGEQDTVNKQAEVERLAAHKAAIAEITLLSDEELALQSLTAQQDKINEEIKKEKDKTNLLKLELEKRALNEKIIKTKQDLEEKQRITAFSKFQQWANENEIRNKQDTFSRIATLSQSNNSTLVTIGKAAALANIAISTAEGVARALGAFPPPINFVAAAAVGAAGAVQAAQVAGVALAEGGIVKATPGGIPAIIGEGGRDEAVIPLGDDRASGLGQTIVNLTVYGGLLGDEDSARQLAIALDENLYKLRKSNESIAFDSGLI